MPSPVEAKGTCLCCQTQINVTNLDKKIGTCHCGSCRKWGGGPLLAVDCGTEVSFNGEENISVFNSSDWAERGFCKHCGTHLFYRLKSNGQYIMPVGLFGDVEGLVFDHQIFIEEKPDYYQFANKTKNMTGAEVFAQFGPQ